MTPSFPHSAIDLSQINNYQKSDKSAVTSQFVDNEAYFKAEKKANWYINQILQITQSEDYLGCLKSDYQQWSKSDTRLNAKLTSSLVSLSELEGKQQLDESLDTWTFLEKLDAEKKLKTYLKKSISYIYMRDLGKSLSDKLVQKQIKQAVKKVNQWIKTQTSSDGASNNTFDTAFLFEKAKQHGIEPTFEWLMDKLSSVKQSMPEEIDQTNGMRKLVKIIAGVVLHQLVDSDESDSAKEKSDKLSNAIKLGFSYGITYPLVDDLQDSSAALNGSDKEKFNQAIRQSLLNGQVVDCPAFSKSNQSKMEAIYRELREAFKLIRSLQSTTQARKFFEQAFVFFEAQDIDRSRELDDRSYTDQELFLPVILKSAGCRLIAREIIEDKSNQDFDYRTFCFGIYNQFNDDIKDVFDDLEENNVTPYTYYLKNGSASESENKITNPYRIYWAVVFYLIKEVYQNNPESKKLLLERSINAHKSLRWAIGDESYEQLRKDLLNTGNKEFDKLIHQQVMQPNDVAWFDKLISREISEHFSQQDKKREEFKSKLNQTKEFIEKNLSLSNHSRLKASTLINAANYSLLAGGKRLRSVLAHTMCVDRYGFSPEQSINVIKLLEYMHTASIIFDDKPSQDNSDLRRGKASLHAQYQCEATAELAGVFLMMRAVEVQSQIKEIEPQRVLESLSYAANTTQAICEGQLQDLKLNLNTSDIEQLEQMSLLKTGLAIEAALMIPAILAGENDIEKGHIKQFAKHLGLAFQIKDDLLDLTSNSSLLGKPVSLDVINNKASFVTCLGEDKAIEKLYYHYHSAQDLLEHMLEVKGFMAQILDYVVYRNS